LLVQILYLSGQIKSFNANIFDYAGGGDKDILTNVTKAVAKFYVILRNICAIVMLAGLIFTGIRILLSANIPTKKTQYLMLLQDWLIGMALLIFSHIIMILVFEMCDALVAALSVSMGSGSIKWEIIKQMGGSFDSTTQIIALVLYIWVNWLLIVFAIAYFKRFFWTCILVIFAPVMAVMYAFGQQTKQIYSNWLKEFILNAFVQPFHLVVYTVLITFPMEIANGGSWTWSWNNGTEMSYCLMGMSMIRPAEKYLRRLFQMDKGIVNMASYDSGKQTITDIAKAIVNAIKAAVAVGATVMTAGAAAGAIGATGAAGSVGSAAGALGSQGAAGALGEADGALGDAGGALGEAGDALGQLGAGDNTPEWIADGWDTDSQGRFFNPYDEEWYTQDQLMNGKEPTYMDQDDFSEADVMALKEGIKDGNDENIEASLANGQNLEELAQDNDKESMLSAANISIGNANVEMNAGGILGDLAGLQAGGAGTMGEMLGEGNEDGIEELEKERRSLTSQQGNLTRKINALGKEEQQLLTPSEDDWMFGAHMENGMEGSEDDEKNKRLSAIREERAGLMSQRDDIVSRKEEIGEQISTMKENRPQIAESSTGTGQTLGNSSMTAGNITINASSVNMQGGDNIKTVETIEKGNENTTNGSEQKVEVELTGGDGISLEGAIDGASFGEIFKNLGGIEQLGNLANDLIDGAHSISSGLYVDGMAPTQEWNANSQWRRQNIKEAGEKRKENVERAKDNWAHDKANITIMADKYYKEKYLPEMQAKYGDTKSQSYIEAQAREKSEEKAKAALKDMSAYVPYGVTDVNLAYNLYQNANNNGFSPEQSIRNMAAFNKFNSSAGNIDKINLSGNFQRNDYTSVEAAIPNAKTYYDAGYTNVNDMAWVDYMAEKLGKSPEFAMKVDETLKKKGKGGKLSYNGSDADMKKVIDQINSHYD